MEKILIGNLFESMLRDENGVSEETYHALLDVIFHTNGSLREDKRITAMIMSVDATDGRFYIPSND